MKNKNRSLILIVVCCLIFSCTVVFAENGTNGFVDVPTDHWASEAIQSMSNQGIISGYPDGSFAPDASVTREQFAKMLALTFGLDLVNPDVPTFRDVNSSKWSYQYIETAREYLTGYFPPVGKPFFDPTSNATREDIAVALVKVMGLSTEGIDGQRILMSNFTDYESVSPQLANEVAVAVQNNLIKGFPDGTFQGSSAINRASVATLFYRVLKSSYFNASKDIELEIDIPDRIASNTLQISGTVGKDAKLFINDKEYSVNNGTFNESFLLKDGEGTYELTFKALMPNGRSKIVKKQVVYEISGPQLTVTCPETSDKPTVTIKGTVSDASGYTPTVAINDEEAYVSYNGEWSKEITLREGDNELNIVAKNRSGKTASVQKIITLKLNAPTITFFNVPETSNSKTITVSGKVSDANDNSPKLYLNDSQVYVDWGGNFSKDITLNEGDNSLVFKVVNSSGKSTTITKNVTFEVGAPTIKFDNVPETTTSKTITIPGTVSDANDSDPKLYLNDTEVFVNRWNGSFSESVTLTEGDNSLVFKAVNSLGKSTTVTKNITFSIVGPSIDVTVPSTANTSSVTLQGKITDSNYSSSQLTLTVNGRAISIGYSGSWSYTAQLNEGQNTITIIGMNPAGKQTTVQKTVDYTIVPPTIDVSVPSSTNSLSIDITGVVNDPAGNYPKLTINGSNISLNSSGSFTKRINLVEGENTITFTAISNVTGRTGSLEKTITVTILPPTLNANIPDTTDINSIQISGNVYDTLDGSPTVNVNGSSVTVNSSGNWNTTLTLAPGENPITVTASNKYGKTTTVEKTIVYQTAN